MKMASFWGSGIAVSEDCAKCGLHSKCKSPFTGVYGEGKMETLLIMEKPSNQEDMGRSPYGGSTMSKLSNYFEDMGIDLKTAFWKCNAIGCYSSKRFGDGKPELCRSALIKTIKKYKPKHIIPVGFVAAKTLFGHMVEKMPGEEALTSLHIPIHEYGAWVHPIMNPAKMRTKNETAFFERHLKEAVRGIKIHTPLPQIDPFEKVEVLTDYDDVLDGLEWILDTQQDIMAYDIEATGLKPHWEGHFITSVGIATRERVLAFPLYHNEAFNGDTAYSEDVQKTWMEIMSDPRIKKIAHNRKFDDLWYQVTTGWVPEGGLQCTATNQHLADHRQGTKGLKWQAFARWGIRDYDKRVKPYIESDSKGAKEMNRMHEMPLREQLLYVGADAYLTLLLSDEQDKEHAEDTNPKKHIPRILFHESSDTLRMMESRGVPISIDYYNDIDKELAVKIKEAEDTIRTDEGVIEFKKRHRREFKQTSPIDLKEVLFKIKGHVPDENNKTTSGGIAVDEKALKDIDDPICDAILDHRKLSKLSNTYVSQFKNAEVDNRIYPNFSLVIPRSFRGSCFSPNLQNVPKHDEYANTVCRTGMIPDPGMGMGEMDFKGVEVCVSASYHKDPNFITYLLDPNADMHRDNTADLWLLKPEEVPKAIRYHTKNCWTFPQFYGDWYGSCAPELWKQVITKNNMVLDSGELIIDRIRDNGIMNLKDFTEHCKKAESILWDERFKVYTAWKEEVNDFYIANGYVETFLGFRFTGLLDIKQTGNYPIQGTAFHLLLWCLNKLDKWMVEEKLKSYICLQVHDSIIFVYHPRELEYIKQKMIQVCTIDMLKEFPWINVPMGIDIELCPLLEDGGNYSNIGDKKWDKYDFTFGGK